MSFLVKLEDGRLVRRLQDHLRYRLPTSGNDDSQNSQTQEEASQDVEPEILIDMPPSQTTVAGSPESMGTTTSNSNPLDTEQSVDTAASPAGSPETVETESNAQSDITHPQPTIGPSKRYPGRRRKPPDRYH